MSVKSAEIVWNEIKDQSGEINASLRNSPHLLELNILISQSLNTIFSGVDSDLETIERASQQLPETIPTLSGDTQAYFAKLIRICHLLLEDKQ